MTNTQLIILLVVLATLYLYWKYQHQPALKPKKDTETETFWDASDWELDSDSETEDNKLPAEQQDWFTPQHWLSDQEIDWALEQIKQQWITANSSEPTPPTDPNTIWCPPASFVPVPFFKILESTQFMFLANVPPDDLAARIAFLVLLSELTDNRQELVFIPVNNPDFHWSLLVYEIKSKKFYHYDTLQGANYSYVESLCTELTKHLRGENHPTLTDYLVKKHQINQGNTYDCGIAVITITNRIIKQYQGQMTNLTLGQFDFASARIKWRKRLINYYAQTK